MRKKIVAKGENNKPLSGQNLALWKKAKEKQEEASRRSWKESERETKRSVWWPLANEQRKPSSGRLAAKWPWGTECRL